MQTQALKERNDLMERLLSDINRLQKQNKQLATKLRKTQAAVELGNLKSKETKQQTKDDTWKQTKTMRDQKAKIDTLTTTLKEKEIEISQLTQRLNIKLNMDERQRHQVIQNFRKFQGRKPNSAQDQKTIQLIQYYDLQLEKKDYKIQQLQKQVSHNVNLTLTLKKQLIAKQKENESLNGNTLQSTRGLRTQMQKMIQQMDINKLKKQLDRKTIMIQKLRSQLKQLRGKYEDLTKDYYQIFNQLGEKQKIHKRISHYEVDSDQEPTPSIVPQKRQQQQRQKQKYKSQQNSEIRQQYEQILNKLLQVYDIKNYSDIVCSAIASDMALKNLPSMQNYLTSIKLFLQSNLKQRINFQDLQQHLKSLETLINMNTHYKSIIHNIFNQLSLTESSYMLGIKQLKQNNKQYIQDLKTIKHVRQLSISKQIQQFIDFFKLNPDEPLNPQIVTLYEQLKSLQKFIQLCNKILDTEYQPHRCMEHIVQVLQRIKSQQNKTYATEKKKSIR